MILYVNGQERPVEDRVAVEALIGPVSSRVVGECWLERAGSGNLCLLSNGALAFLMHLPPDDPAGWSSRNGTSESEPVEFLLANGEVQMFPRHFCIDVEDAWKAFLTYADKGIRAPWVHWHDDNI